MPVSVAIATFVVVRLKPIIAVVPRSVVIIGVALILSTEDTGVKQGRYEGDVGRVAVPE